MPNCFEEFSFFFTEKELYELFGKAANLAKGQKSREMKLRLQKRIKE